MPQAAANWLQLLRLMLRRDRLSVPAWIVSVVVFAAFLVPLMPQMAGTPDKLASLVQMANNPATIAMCGVIFGDAPNMGVLYSQMMMVWTGMLAAVMSVLVVVRHTAEDEQAGRLELIRAQPTGKLANLTAVGVLVLGMNTVVALLIGVSMAAFRVDSIDLAGSLSFGAAIGACGLIFASLAMLVVQLISGARAASTIVLSVMGIAYIWRAFGDLGSEAVARLSPLGLMQRTYPFFRDLWWPVLVLVGVIVVVAAIAFGLASGRDVGRGWLPQSQGKAHASRLLASPSGLIWQLFKGPVIAWAITAFVLSAAYGAVMDQMESFVLSNPLYQQLMGMDGTSSDVIGPVVVTLMLLMALMAVIPLLTTAFQLIGEERAGRLDLVLGTALSRVGFFVRLSAQVGLVAVIMQLATAVGFWSVATYVMTDPVPASTVFGIAVNYFAALLAFGGLGLCLAGWAKRFTWVAWVYLAVSFLIVYLGDMANLPSWTQKLSPFGMLPRWPSDSFNWLVWLSLVVVGIVLAVIGVVGFSRRDIDQR